MNEKGILAKCRIYGIKVLSVYFIIGMIMFFVLTALWVLTESSVFVFLALGSLITSMLCSQLTILLFDYMRARVNKRAGR